MLSQANPCQNLSLTRHCLTCSLFLTVKYDEFMMAKNNEAAVDAAIVSAAVLASPRASGPALEKPVAVTTAGDSVAPVYAQPLLPPGRLKSDQGHSGEARGLQGEGESTAPATWLQRLVAADWFSNAAIGLVLLNMALMCVPYEGMPAEDADRLEGAFNAISLAFIVEMAIKLAALGCEGYWTDGWNALDGTIVLISTLEMVLTLVSLGTGIKVSFLRMLRLLRVLRVLRLMRSWKGLYRIVSSFIRALPQLFNMFVLMFLTMLIFALMGMQLFGGQYDEKVGYSREPCVEGASTLTVCPDPNLEPMPRFHFDYFQPAMFTVFVLLTGKWTEAMVPATRVTGFVAVIFFVLCVVIGIYLIMNLFVAILLNAFAEDFQESALESRSKSGARSRSEDNDDEDDDDDEAAGGKDPELLLAQRLVPASATLAQNASDGRQSPSKGTVAYKAEQKVKKALARKRAKVEVFTEQSEWRDTFACLPPGSRWRELCVTAAASPYFDPIIIVVILASSVTLAIDSPRIDETSDLATTLRSFDHAFLLIFTLEMLIKIVTLGFIGGPNAYCKSGWNLLDMFIVTVSYLSLLAEVLPALRRFALSVSCRCCDRCVCSRATGMKLVITSLFHSLPDVSNVFGVVLTLQLVFAILGMQLFMGDLAGCTDPTITTKEACVAAGPSSACFGATGTAKDFSAGDAAGDAFMQLLSPSHGRALKHLPEDTLSMLLGRIRLPCLGHSTTGSVMLLLYVMSTADDWDVVMFRTMDATVRGSAPVRNDFSLSGFYSIAWMFVGCFFGMNLFIGVIVDNFNRIKRRLEKLDEGGTATMTSEQQMWSKALVMSMNNAAKRPKKRSLAPTHPFRSKVHELVHSTLFEGAIFVVIVVNIALMACDYYGIEDDIEIHAAYHSAMATIVRIYYAECVLKIVGMGKQYFLDMWCQLDSFLVVVALLDEFASAFLAALIGGQGGSELLRLLRVLRILRILRLLKGAVELKKLILTIMLCVAPLVNVSALLLLTVFIYAVLGVHLFTFVEHQAALGDENNFDTLSNAALLLFQCLTGDGWGVLMMEASVQQDSGRCDEAAGNHGSHAAIPATSASRSSARSSSSTSSSPS